MSQTPKHKQVAVVLMNLGGPDSLKSVRPFLFNLFRDPAIIQPFFPHSKILSFLTSPLRLLLALMIAVLRTPKAKDIYRHLKGKSPLLKNTHLQAKALENFLNNQVSDYHFRVFTAMRYWHPLIKKTARDVKNFDPARIVLLPLYPQFSTTTTRSSFREWDKHFKKNPSKSLLQRIPCYFKEPGFIGAMADLIRLELKKIEPAHKVRLLFSAHGLPQHIIDQGDPYEQQVNESTAAVMTCLKNHPENASFELESVVCYQSKVGKLKWIGPSLEEEMVRAALDQRGVIIVPISFVSEHSETLVELDIDFKKRAFDLKLPFYRRVPTLMMHELFIKGLATLVEGALQKESVCDLPVCVCSQLLDEGRNVSC